MVESYSQEPLITEALTDKPIPFGREPEAEIGHEAVDLRMKGRRDQRAFEALTNAQRAIEYALRGAEGENWAESLQSKSYESLRQRLLDLSVALSDLEDCRDLMLKRHQSFITEVVDRAPSITQMIREYAVRQNPPDGRLSRNSILVELIPALHELPVFRLH